jgi:hypothetical protein
MNPLFLEDIDPLLNNSEMSPLFLEDIFQPPSNQEKFVVAPTGH